MKKFIFILLSLISFFTIRAHENVLQIFDGKDYDPVPWDIIDKITFKNGNLLLNLDNGEKTVVPFSESINMPSGLTIPLIEINTEEKLSEIPDKINYKKAVIELKGFEVYEDVISSMDIRGRGNSSWGFPKKPYRLKFDKKISLCGLPKAKSYVLLANYTDTSLIQNALAFKIGQMLGLPFTNQFVPVDVKLNGLYKGSYLLTNKPGLNSGSVDIDEDNSIMWELDVNYDEDLKFRSPILDLPVMVSDPDLTQDQFEEWKADFIAMEKAAVEYNASSKVDMEILAKYVLVNEILKNDEIGYPKSVKLYKTRGGKYIFGPIWDFDTAMGKKWEGGNYTFDKIEDPVWKNTLLSYLSDDPEYKDAIKANWKGIRGHLSELLDFISEYADLIQTSAQRNQTIWKTEDFDNSIKSLKYWLANRFIALDAIYN